MPKLIFQALATFEPAFCPIICSERAEVKDTHLSQSLITLLYHSALINYCPSRNASRFDFVRMGRRLTNVTNPNKHTELEKRVILMKLVSKTTRI